jgi:serine/threonine protein kinase
LTEQSSAFFIFSGAVSFRFLGKLPITPNTMREKTPSELANYKVGSIISNRYEILEVLGWGGMGFVVKVRDTVLNGEIIALKVLYARHAKDDTTLARFRREVILARKVSHHYVVRMFDMGFTDTGDFFISMEFVEGITLQKMLMQGPLAAGAAIDCVRRIAEGLQCAHSYGILHRDLKPTNILIQPDGSPKIADFGTARAIFSQEQLTQADELVGTPLYISPEAIRTGSADTRSDIYALGLMAFAMVERYPPFNSPNWAVLANQHLSAEVPLFTRADVPRWYRELVEQCLEKRPEDRFQSAEEVCNFISRQTNAPDDGRSRWQMSFLAASTALCMGTLFGAVFL